MDPETQNHILLWPSFAGTPLPLLVFNFTNYTVAARDQIASTTCPAPLGSVAVVRRGQPDSWPVPRSPFYLNPPAFLVAEDGFLVCFIRVRGNFWNFKAMPGDESKTRE